MLPIVVPVFHGSFAIRRLIGQLKMQTFKDWELIIVNHGPHELGIASEARIHILNRPTELWFTAALNRGIEWVLQHRPAALFVALANDDIEFSSPNFLSVATKCASDRALLGVRGVDQNGENLYSSVSFSKLFPQFRWTRKRKSGVAVCDALPTRFLIAPASSFRQLGLLDEEGFPMYLSDYEWSMNAKTKGYDLFMLQDEFVKTEVSKKSRGPGKAADRLLSPAQYLTMCLDSYQSDSLILWYRLLRKQKPGLLVHGMIYQTFRKIGAYILAQALAAFRPRKYHDGGA